MALASPSPALLSNPFSDERGADARGRKQLLCTLGPASLNERVIVRLTELGASLFRLNLSHTKLRDVARIIRMVRALTPVPLSLDTEGAQIRTGDLVQGRIRLVENSIVRSPRGRVPGDSHEFNLYPPGITDSVEVGDFVHLDADVLAQVIEVTPDGIALRVLVGGEISQNKAVTVDREIAMDPLTEKDRRIIVIGRELGIRHFALSFAHSAEDVDALRAIAGPEAVVISKIECLPGLANVRSIAERSDAILIDRGDLSRQIPLEMLPATQKRIIRDAHEVGRPVYVATNLMESMTLAPVPTRAEVNDVYNTLMDGADGLVLAAETAVGRYPIGCASMVVRLISVFDDRSRPEAALSAASPISLLVDPHGGRLVQQSAPEELVAELDRLPVLRVDAQTLRDCENIGLGHYSPLTGFMDLEALESVLRDDRLPDGTPWPSPVVLPLHGFAPARLAPGSRVGLAGLDGRVHAVLDVDSVFEVDLEDLAERWLGRTGASRGGTHALVERGNRFASGKLWLVERPASAHRRYELTPLQMRAVFAKKGWTRVLGVQAAGLPLRTEEKLQLEALEASHADGMLIAPEIGPTPGGPFRPDAILRCYQMLLEFGIYPSGRAVLGAVQRCGGLDGPRGHALEVIRLKNLGCSHIVVRGPSRGAEDAGNAVREILDRLGDLGVSILHPRPLGYDSEADDYRPLGEPGVHEASIEALAHALRSGGEAPEWLLRDFLQDQLRADLEAGLPVLRDDV
jgi:pyruvate kinase/ATP sulfurylase